MATKEDLDRTAVGVLRAEVPALVAVYRFGSSVDGAEHVRSDIDLAFLAAAPLAGVARFDLQQQLSDALGRPVDLVDLRAASSVMTMQVLAHGRLLYDADPATRGAFEDLAYSTYARFNEERRGIMERIASEGTVYGR